MGIKKAVTTRFQELCAEKKIRMNTLANNAGITPSTVYSMLDDSRKDIGIVTVKKLCDGLDISIEDFFSSRLFRDLEQEIE